MLKIDPLVLKRLAAILFLVVIVFNFYGYRIVISYMQESTDAALEKRLDRNDYDETKLVSIKTTLHLPYYSSSTGFERAYGTITINGNSYQYVKRRVHHDTLEVLCLSNDAKTQMQAVKNEITKALADGQASTPKKQTNIKIALPDFFQQFRTFAAKCPPDSKKYFEDYSASTVTGYRLKHKKPPRLSDLSC